jgi:hypothetical protein
MEVGLDYQVHQKIEGVDADGSEHERANEIDVPAAAALSSASKNRLTLTV